MKTINKIITKCNTKYGAPMGRANVGTEPKGVRIYNCAVPMPDGCYDKGGAYWGHGAQLRVKYTKDLSYVEFYRLERINNEKYELPSHWASYLINSDPSGLSDEDIRQCDEDTANLGYCIDVSAESDFRQYRGLGTDVSIFTFRKDTSHGN
jgi:hypothetical protein